MNADSQPCFWPFYLGKIGFKLSARQKQHDCLSSLLAWSCHRWWLVEPRPGQRDWGICRSEKLNNFPHILRDSTLPFSCQFFIPSLSNCLFITVSCPFPFHSMTLSHIISCSFPILFSDFRNPFVPFLSLSHHISCQFSVPFIFFVPSISVFRSVPIA